jgi:hypothetical protein
MVLNAHLQFYMILILLGITQILIFEEWKFINWFLRGIFWHWTILVWWPNIALWERILRHQRNWRIWNPPNLTGSLFVLLICITENTQVFNFSNSNFWPMPLSFLSNAPSLALLICCSLLLLPPSPSSHHSVSPAVISHK